MRTTRPVCSLVLIAIVLGSLSAAIAAEPAGSQARRDQLRKTYRDGNYKGAYEGFRRLALDPDDDPLKVGDVVRDALRGWCRCPRQQWDLCPGTRQGAPGQLFERRGPTRRGRR